MTVAATYAETGLVSRIEQLTGGELASLTPSQLDAIDQFHAGGAEAVELIRPSLRLRPGMRVLDVGSGLGGPARQMARSSACAVVGLDTSTSYVETAQALTRVADLTGRVEFIHGDISHFEGGTFDAAYTMHVQMNVAEKVDFFHAIAARLAPGAHLATFEVCRTGPENPAPPLPWSLDGTDSFLATADELRASIEAGGFEAREWVDETAWVMQWFEHVAAASASPRSSAVLPALLTDGPTRMMNFARALHSGVLGIHRGAFTKSGR